MSMLFHLAACMAIGAAIGWGTTGKNDAANTAALVSIACSLVASRMKENERGN